MVDRTLDELDAEFRIDWDVRFTNARYLQSLITLEDCSEDIELLFSDTQ